MQEREETTADGHPQGCSPAGRTGTLFWFFVGAHVLVWTLVPALMRQVTPMDATEASAWGRHLQFGYPRDPWLIAWLARALTELGRGQDWPFYLAAQLCVAAGMSAIWRLGRALVGEPRALLAVFMLEGVQFVSVAAIDFNDNVLLLALWPLSTLAFYRSLRFGHPLDWALLGSLAGLSLMAKYSSVVLLAAMLLYLVVDSRARSSWRRLGPWLALAVLGLVVAPHLWWLAGHDGLTLHYSTRQLQSHDAGWVIRHIIWPLRFAGTLLATFSGALLLLLLMLWRSGSVGRAPPDSLPISSRRLLWIVGLLPTALVVALAALRGWWLRSLWGMPLVSLWGLVLLASLDLRLSGPALRRALRVSLLAMVAVAGGKALSYGWPGRQSSCNYPMRELTREIEQRWHERFGQPLKHVAGHRVPAAYVVRYASDRPDLLVDFDLRESPWLTRSELERDGAVLVRRLRTGTVPPAAITEELADRLQPLAARLEPAWVITHAFARARTGQPPMRLEVVFLPPGAPH